MPVHRVAVDDQLEDTVDHLQRLARVVAVCPAGDGCVLVFTEPKEGRVRPGSKETR